MTRTLGVGDFLAWDGGCLLIGEQRAPTGVHAHYAVQLSFGAVDGIRFREAERDDWTSYDAVVIASRQPHAMDATDVSPSATLLIERETAAGRALTGRFTTAEDGIARLRREQPYAAGLPGWRHFEQCIANVPAYELRRLSHPDKAVDEVRSLIGAGRPA